jgi:hypothetical protein
MAEQRTLNKGIETCVACPPMEVGFLYTAEALSLLALISERFRMFESCSLKWRAGDDEDENFCLVIKIV